MRVNTNESISKRTVKRNIQPLTPTINWHILSAALLYHLSHYNILFTDLFISSFSKEYFDRKYCEGAKLAFADNQLILKYKSLRKTYFRVVFSRLDSDFVTVRAPKSMSKDCELKRVLYVHCNLTHLLESAHFAKIASTTLNKLF